MLLPRQYSSFQKHLIVTPTFRRLQLPPFHTHRIPVHTHTSPLDFEATWTLTLSSVLGIIADRYGILGGNSGTIITLLSASFLSNVGFAPYSHRFYDICWTTLLPATLAFTLLSNDSQDNDETAVFMDESFHPIARRIFTSVCISFIIASTGIDWIP